MYTNHGVTIAWVQKEIEVALEYKLPILPVVVEDPVFGPPNYKGGRFRMLQNKQQQFPDPGDEISDISNDMDNGFYNKLEERMKELLLMNSQSRRNLITSTKNILTEKRGFSSPEEPDGKLMLNAEKDIGTQLTPELKFRILCQCSPYGTLIRENVTTLASKLSNQVSAYQYGVLVHNTPASAFHRSKILKDLEAQNLMILKPDEIEQAIEKLIEYLR